MFNFATENNVNLLILWCGTKYNWVNVITIDQSGCGERAIIMSVEALKPTTFLIKYYLIYMEAFPWEFVEYTNDNRISCYGKACFADIESPKNALSIDEYYYYIVHVYSAPNSC